MKRTHFKATLNVLLSGGALFALTGCGAPEGQASDQVSPEAPSDVSAVKEALSNGAQGFAWVASGAVGAGYYYNTSGGTISATHPSTGSYNVSFQGIGGSGGNVQVVGYGSGSSRCKVTGWSYSGTTENVGVMCHTAAGALTNGDFVIQFGRKTTNNGVGAYLWTDQPSAASYTPSPTYSWNSTNGTNTISRFSAGYYNVILPGLAVGGGSVQVTAYGTSGDHCKVNSWGTSGSAESVYVRCFNATGAATDSPFSLNFFGANQVGPHDYGAYAWANDSTSASYTPAAAYSYNSGDINGWAGCTGWIGANSAGRTATGSYFMRHTFLDPYGSAVHVTAYGSDSSYCKVGSWTAYGNGTEANIECFSASGAPVNTEFVETYSSHWVRGPC